MRERLLSTLTLLGLAITSALTGDNYPIVGRKQVYPTKNIIENAVNSADHTTLVTAVKTAGLVDTLSGTGPFTVFAPTKEAFDSCPPALWTLC